MHHLSGMGVKCTKEESSATIYDRRFTAKRMSVPNSSCTLTYNSRLHRGIIEVTFASYLIRSTFDCTGSVNNVASNGTVNIVVIA
jgi:hypothetical protein